MKPIVPPINSRTTGSEVVNLQEALLFFISKRGQSSQISINTVLFVWYSDRSEVWPR